MFNTHFICRSSIGFEWKKRASPLPVQYMRTISQCFCYSCSAPQSNESDILKLFQQSSTRCVDACERKYKQCEYKQIIKAEANEKNCTAGTRCWTDLWVRTSAARASTRWRRIYLRREPSSRPAKHPRQRLKCTRSRCRDGARLAHPQEGG